MERDQSIQESGFSTFAAQRPKYCVLAGSTGTHAVCVCKHQNPKLAEACLKSSVHDFMKVCVCSIESEKCIMGHCKDCPGREGLIEHMNNCEELSALEDVSYLQWVSTDRAKLVTIIESKTDFIESKTDFIESKADFIESKADFIESKTDFIESKADFIESKADFIESKADFIESKADFIESKTDFIESKADIIESKADFIESKADFIESKTDFIESKADFIESKADFIESKADFIESKADFIESKADFIESKADFIESKADFIESKADFIESKADFIESKADFIESKADIIESKADFIDNFSSQVVKLTRHSLTTKAQNIYRKELKANMKPLDIILQADFAENFSYVVQDEIQSFHWENKQATLHPVVAYHMLVDGTLEHCNICVG